MVWFGGSVGCGRGGVCCVLLLVWVVAVECLVVAFVWVGVSRRLGRGLVCGSVCWGLGAIELAGVPEKCHT